MIYFWPKLWKSGEHLAVQGRKAGWPHGSDHHEWIIVTQVWGPIYIWQTEFVDADYMFTPA